jgi:hypothetical protein
MSLQRVVVYLAIITVIMTLAIAPDAEQNRRMDQSLREIPNWVILGFSALVFLFLGWVYTIARPDPKAKARRMEIVRNIADNKWHVKGAAVYSENPIVLDVRGWRNIDGAISQRLVGSGYVTMTSVHPSRQELNLGFRPGHPSIELLPALSYLDVIEFEVVDTPLDCALEEELCAHLVIKSYGSKIS